MKSSRLARDRGPRENYIVKLFLITGVVCCVVGLVVWLSDFGNAYDALSPKAQSPSRSWMKTLSVRQSTRKIVRKADVEDTFGTIFHSELMSQFNLHAWTPDHAEKLLATLKQMESTGIKTVVYSISWDYAAPDEHTLRWAYINNITDIACKNTGLKVDFIVDMLRSPNWLFHKYPDSKAQDAGARSYPHMSWFHEPANTEALDMLKRVGDHLASKFGGCVLAIQPVYNNEYEAKFTQEYDSYQDYSPAAKQAYRDWLHGRQKDVDVLNRRWGTSFSNWTDVEPPAVNAGQLMGVEDGARYWDWMSFRADYGSSVFNRACATVQAAGLKCFHHFPEFFSVLDAMYSASMFPRIAASPHTDFIIMDSNFMTPYRTVMNPVKLRLYVAAAGSYGKPVYFEAAVERYASLDLLQAGFKNAKLAGAPNLGITNWIGRVEMNSSLQDAMYAPQPCEAKEVVGVFVHLASCTAWQGLQWHWKERDPLHNFIEDIAERLTAECTTDISVYIELDRFLADIPRLTRAVFVEPLLLFNSTELGQYVAVKSALQTIPHEVLTLPSNSSRGLYLKVLQDLGSS